MPPADGHSPSVQSQFDEGVGLHRAGRLEEAARRYEAAIAGEPAHFDALHMLGLVLTQLGEAERGAAVLAEAVRVSPGVAAAHSHLGLALTALGRFEAAAESCARAIRLDPANVQARVNLGNALMALDRWAEALDCYDAAAQLAPGYPEAHYNRGNALRALGRLDAAAAAYGAALALRPAYLEARANRAAVLIALGRPAEALADYDAALALAPDRPELHADRAKALNDLKRSVEALAACERAAALRPGYAEAHNNRAIALFDLRRLEAAVAACDAALAARPDYPEAWNNRGMALHDLKRHREALADYDHALALRPDFPEAHLNRAMCLLALGELKDGFEAYAWRWRPGSPWPLVRPAVAAPEWAGEDLAGRSVLVHTEQGFGDSLQFVRFVPELARRGARVTLLAEAPLARLFAASLPGVEVTAALARDPGFDFMVSVMCLPRLLGTTLATIPGETPYLAADPAAAASWAARIAAPSGGLKVGLVWAGDARPGAPGAHAIDRRRSLRLDQFAPLAGVPGVRFFSLQKGAPAAQARTPPPGLEMADFTDELTDFADTAALTAALDLVITVDTAVAHLAGALATPVWILSRHDGCWRWLNGREDSPWYPTARLYHQRAAGDWAEVMARVAADLAFAAAFP